MDGITPRVSAAYLENFQHQTVRMVGKVTQLRGEQATIDSAGSVSLVLNRVCPFFPSPVHSTRFCPPLLRIPMTPKFYI
jgi:hypothetical protein